MLSLLVETQILVDKQCNCIKRLCEQKRCK